MTSIEDLANELFYEIFEYLNGYDIYNAFLNLNIRFQNFLIYSSQSFKIDLSEKSESMIEYYFRQISIPNNNQIISLRLLNISTMEKFLDLTPFNHLESLVLIDMNSCAVVPFLKRFISLPRLNSLTVQSDYDNQDPEEIYQSLFCLPVLKYCKISLMSSVIYWLLSFTMNNEYISSIERLIIDHDRTIEELFRIFSHTPRLSHLTCKSIQTSMRYPENMSLNLPNLKYVSINNHDASFEEFELFFRKIHSQIEILHFKTSKTMNYVDANRWEQLILKYMSHLHTFYFQCSVNFKDKFQFIRLHEKSNGFISSFWIERKWFFQLKIDVNETRHTEMTYSIHPYRNDYSGRQFTDKNSKQSAELILTGTCTIEDYQRFIDDHSDLFKTMSINRLNIDNYKHSSELLIKLLRILPNITSLDISPFSMDISKSKDLKKIEDSDSISNNNSIMKVSLGKIDELVVNHFIFMNIWHHVEYLEIICTKNVNIKMIIRIILKKYATYIPQLRSLYLHMTKINDKMIEQLQSDLPNFLNNYTIQHIDNRFYLQWK